MNLSDHGNPFPIAASGSTPPASPAKASSSTPSTSVRYTKLKKLNLGGGAGIGGPDIEADVKDAMQDSPILMRQQATSPYSDLETDSGFPTTSLINFSPLSNQQSTEAAGKRSSMEATSSVPSDTSSPTRPRSQRAKGRPLSLQYRPYASTGHVGSSDSVSPLDSAELNQSRRSRTPQFHRARRRSTERSDSFGTVRSPTIPEGDESTVGTETNPIFSDEAWKRRSLGSFGRRTKDDLGNGMGMAPKRSAPLTLVEEHAVLLSTIAKKETQVNETRQELKAQEIELAILKAEWESIVSRSAMISTTSAKSKTSLNRPGDEVLLGSEVPGAATATAALEGGKKLLGQLMGSIHLGTSGISSDSQDLPPSKDPVNFATTASNAQGHRSALNARSNPSQVDRDHGRRPVPARGSSEQSGRNGRRTSFASDTASEEASRSNAPGMTRARPQEEALGGLGFGQVLEGMVDPGEWTRRWGEVMSNPQVQAGSKRASTFLSASLADTYSLLSQALPTPNLAALNPPNDSGHRDTVARSSRQDGIRKVPPAPSNRRRLAETTSRPDMIVDDLGESEGPTTDAGGTWDW